MKLSDIENQLLIACDGNLKFRTNETPQTLEVNLSFARDIQGLLYSGSEFKADIIGNKASFTVPYPCDITPRNVKDLFIGVKK